MATTMTDMSLPPVLTPSLPVRDAIKDALYRFLTGMDTNDAALFDSAFTADAKWALNRRDLDGLPAIHADCYDSVISQLDTTHYATNIRIHVADDEKTATLSALYQAQHYRGGRGKVGGATSFVTGGQYWMQLVKEEEGLWKIKVFKMRSIWSEGDVTIMGHD